MPCFAQGAAAECTWRLVCRTDRRHGLHHVESPSLNPHCAGTRAFSAIVAGSKARFWSARLLRRNRAIGPDLYVVDRREFALVEPASQGRCPVAGLWLGGRCELGTMPEVRRAYPSTLSWSALTCSPLQTFFDVHGFAGPAQNGSVAGNPRGSHAAEHR